MGLTTHTYGDAAFKHLNLRLIYWQRENIRANPSRRPAEAEKDLLSQRKL